MFLVKWIDTLGKDGKHLVLHDVTIMEVPIWQKYDAIPDE
jgi:hypothetical protein